MAHKFFKLTKDDLCLVARTKGWKGGNPTRQSMLDWFQANGITMDEVMAHVGRMRAAVRGELAPTGAAAPSVSKGDVFAMVAEALASKDWARTQDEKTMRKLIADELSRATPGKIVLDGPEAKPVKLDERTHPMFEKALRLVRAGLNVLLVGPAGCGKTTLAQQLAKALKRKYGTLHCTAGASESQLTGWLLPVGEGKSAGKFSYVPSEFVRLYEEGNSVFLLDEIDAADPNMLLVINGALANGHLHVQQRYDNPHVARGKNVALMAAANTYGTGADSMYAGRNQLDAATLDRFYVVEMGYDVALEASLVGEAGINPAWRPAPQPDAAELKAIGAWVASMREKATVNRLRRVVSTRTVQKAVAARCAGVPLPEVKRDLLAGWTRDELAKIGGAL